MAYALVIIDMQQWMFEREGRKEQLPAVIEKIHKLTQLFDRLDLPIFDCRVTHKADKSTWSRAMLDADAAVLIEGTDDVAPVDGFTSPARAHIIEKPANSIFIKTDFKEKLEEHGVDKLVMCGAFIDGCVGLSAADAEQYGYEVTLVDDAVAHAREYHRPFMFEWLSSMYGLNCKSTATVLEQFE